MKIALDFDDVITDTMNHLLEFYNDNYNLNLSLKDIVKYHIWDVLNHGPKKGMADFKVFVKKGKLDEIKPLKGSINAVKYLLNSFDISIITSRPENLKPYTEKWLEKYVPELMSKVYYEGSLNTQKTKSKADICKKLKIPLLVDDRDKHALDCVKNNIPVILFDKPWNQNVNHELITRVSDWNEALAAISIFAKM